MPAILVALPVYNEQAHVADVLDRVRQFNSDILVVDDGSSDGTGAILDRRDDIQVVKHPKNLGYGAALRSAFAYAFAHDYDLLVTIDCDGQHQPELIPALAAAVTNGVDIVSGSRYLQPLPGGSIPPEDRRRINATITREINQRLELSLTDAFCGFKAYRVSALRQFAITETGYAMPLQLWVQAVARGLEIREFAVPLVYLEEERSFGGSLDDARRRLAYYREVLDREINDPAFAADLPLPTAQTAPHCRSTATCCPLS